MAYIYDPTHERHYGTDVLTIGSLVWVGSVYIDRKKGDFGIIIGVEEYNFAFGECVFHVYAHNKVIKTSKVYLVW